MYCFHGELKEAAQERMHRFFANAGSQRSGVGNVAEEHCYLLALAFECGARGQDFFGEMLGGVGRRRVPDNFFDCGSKLRTAFIAELLTRCERGATLRASTEQARAAFATKPRACRIVLLA